MLNILIKNEQSFVGNDTDMSARFGNFTLFKSHALVSHLKYNMNEIQHFINYFKQMEITHKCKAFQMKWYKYTVTYCNIN